ncbi:hypothetical protein [Antarctobacter heliothermus]|uniref:hypothetical protein n=1 Tax=Antarctobacter heliothermus TaxID=74033 RepID=UPI0012FE7D06|nr:hypothetical protein [Antarctobacter heliothermus]
MGSMPSVAWLLGDPGFDGDWCREALILQRIASRISGRKSRDKPNKYDKRKYKGRIRVEFNCARLKDWHRVVTRSGRSQIVFPSAIALAAIALFLL